jgi:hypothetical protein
MDDLFSQSILVRRWSQGVYLPVPRFVRVNRDALNLR